MTRMTIHAILLASTVITGLSATTSQADGIYSYDKDGIHVCIGVWSCLFRETTYPGRDSDGVADHRTTRDHRTPGDADGTDPSDTTGVRDHRTQVRDHRN